MSRESFSTSIRYIPCTGERLFLAGFLIYQILCMWDTTMFPLPFPVELLGKALALGLIAVKILVCDGYSPLRLAGLAAVGVCTAVTVYTAGYLPPFVWVVFLAGSQEVSFKKVLGIYLVVTGAGMLMAYAASMLGVIENLQYVSEKRGIRNSFGIIYTTDFAAHIFYMLVILFYLKGEELRTRHYLGAVMAAVLVYHFCNARLDSASILLTAALFWFGNGITRQASSLYSRPGNKFFRPWPVSDRVRRLWRQGWEKAGPFIMPACMAAALGLTCAYGVGAPSNQGLQELNRLSGNRLYLGWEGIKNYGIHLWGRNVTMVGNGGTTKHLANYSFVDSSYINLLLQAGVLFTAAVLVLYAVSCRKNRHDLDFLYMVALIAVNSVIAHHLAEPAYNPLLLAAFTECVREPGKQGSYSCSAHIYGTGYLRPGRMVRRLTSDRKEEQAGRYGGDGSAA